MKNIIPGWKTHVNTLILAFTPVLGLVGIEIDPETVVGFLDEFSVWIGTGYIGLGAAGLWFRSLAD